VADVDSGTLTTTLTVSSGTINVTAGAGVSGNGSANVSITGTAADINAALAGLSYTGNPDFNGADTLTIATTDGAAATDTDTIPITVNAVNDAPALIVTANASFIENAAPELLSPSVDLTDLDDADLTFASVQITDGSFTGDGDVLTVNGATSGTENGITFTWDATLHALIFNGTSSVANYQALLQTVGFQSTSNNPTDFGTRPQRTLTWTVSDGTDATVATSTVNIAAVNDAPQESVDANAAYTENGPPVTPITISPGATASDVDNVNLVSGVVRIVDGWFDGDLLTVNGLQSGTFLGIDFSYDVGLRALVFTHPASVADYQAFLQAVEFSSTSDNPTNFDANPTRTLRWGLSDGNNYSAAAGSTEIAITAVDDPAVAQNDAVATPETSGTASGNLFANNGSGADSDPDAGSAFVVTAVSGGTVGAQFTLPSGALLTVNANGTFSYDPNHVFDYLPADGSGASNLTATDTFSYTITGGDTATVTVTISGVDSNDTLFDTAGIDSLAGGIGNDFYYVSNTGDVVTEAAGAGSDTVVASTNYALPVSNTVEVLNMLGSGLTGTGTAGAETLISTGGPNTLEGRGGDDYYYVYNTLDDVVEAASAGSDTVVASVNYTLRANVEVLNMLGSGLTGTGTAGADTLISTGGPNTLEGLGGDDSYHVNNTNDTVREAPNGGYDIVAATVDYTLPANVEALYMVGSELTGTGSDNADTLLSSGGPNTLEGLGGDDLYYVNNPADRVIEAANGGYDTVMATVSYNLPANVEAMYMNGSGLTGTGSSGNDTLATLGANTLFGGDGSDMFVFFAGADGATVADFDRSDGDILVFSGFGTEAQGASLTPIGGTTDQWRIQSGLDPTHIETITFSNHAALQAGDWVFV
jgi:VCBS repeat-containing protein